MLHDDDNTPVDTPVDTPEPPAQPDPPPAPTQPTPAEQPKPATPADNDRLNNLETMVSNLTAVIDSLIEDKHGHESQPTSLPWTHRGGRKRNDS